MESLDLKLELNALRYNSHFDSDFDSTTDIDELSERIIEQSNPKLAKVKREIRRLAEPYQPTNNSATDSQESATDWMQSLLARLTKCPNEVIFDRDLNDGEGGCCLHSTRWTGMRKGGASTAKKPWQA